MLRRAVLQLKNHARGRHGSLTSSRALTLLQGARAWSSSIHPSVPSSPTLSVAQAHTLSRQPCCFAGASTQAQQRRHRDLAACVTAVQTTPLPPWLHNVNSVYLM